MMRLHVVTPTERVLETDAQQINAHGLAGAFGLLPRHVDMVAPLPPGVLAYVDAAGVERFVGHDEATLVKHARQVRVATRRAVLGDDLAHLRAMVRAEFLARDEFELTARAALARLEAGVIRRFMELERRER